MKSDKRNKRDNGGEAWYDFTVNIAVLTAGKEDP